MPVCLTCLLEGIAQGTGHMPSELEYVLNLTVDPDAGDEAASAGPREIEFLGEIDPERSTEAGFTAVGVLSGNFGVETDAFFEAEAVANVYNRDGDVAFVHLVVRNESGRATFVADLEPQPDVARNDGLLQGVAFMGWPE